MPLSRKLFALLGTVGAVGLAGCMHGSTDSTPTTMPTTMPMPETNMRSPGPTTMAVPPAVAVPATVTKTMTHTLTKDQPYFTSMPAAGAAPAGIFKAGSKVLVLFPGADYSQVETDMGVTYYTPTDGLQPIGK